MLQGSEYSSFTLEKVIVGVSGQYNDMTSRPFMMHTGQSALDELMIKTNNGTNITQQTVQLENQNIIQVQAEHQGVIEVDGGWQSGRNVFVMVLRNINDGTKFVLSGFTDSDFLYNGEINQYATMTFNSMLELQAIHNYGGSVSYQLFNSDNILSLNNLHGSVSGQNSISGVQRPIDVLNAAAIRQETSMGSSETIAADAPIVHLGMVDSMNLGSRNPELSRATNAASSDFLYRTARAFSDTRLTGTSQDDLSHNLSGAVSSGIVSEGSYQNTPLINTILTNAGSRRNATVSFEELSYVLPNLLQATEIIRGDSGAVMSNTENWLGRSEAIVAAELAAGIPAVMLKLGIQIAGFQMSNEYNSVSLDGQQNTFNFKVNPQDPSQPLLGFIIPEIPQQQVSAAFEAYMRSVVFPTASRGMLMTIDVECSITKDLILSISMNGSPNPVNFVAPTFATSAWSPVSSTTMQSNTSMANGMMNLTSFMVNMQEGNIGVAESNRQSSPVNNMTIDSLF